MSETAISCKSCEAQLNELFEDLEEATKNLEFAGFTYGPLDWLTAPLWESVAIRHDLHRFFQDVKELESVVGEAHIPHSASVNFSEIYPRVGNLIKRLRNLQMRIARNQSIRPAKISADRLPNGLGRIRFEFDKQSVDAIASINKPKGRPKTIYRTLTERNPALKPAKLADLYFQNATPLERRKHRLAFQSVRDKLSHKTRVALSIPATK